MYIYYIQYVFNNPTNNRYNLIYYIKYLFNNPTNNS